jgi:hypothetical protein
MWWSCFSWYGRGPYHIWAEETDKEKAEAEINIARLNAELEPVKRQEWEATQAIQRLDIKRNKSGKKPVWRWNKANGKLSRDSKRGGIDWWRYRKEILMPKLIPYAQKLEAFLNRRDIHPTGELTETGSLTADPTFTWLSTSTTLSTPSTPSIVQSQQPGPVTRSRDARHPAIKASLVPVPDIDDIPLNRIRVLVQEDKAPAHSHVSQQAVYSFYNIQKLLWPGMPFCLSTTTPLPRSDLTNSLHRKLAGSEHD